MLGGDGPSITMAGLTVTMLTSTARMAADTTAIDAATAAVLVVLQEQHPRIRENHANTKREEGGEEVRNLSNSKIGIGRLQVA